MKLRFKFIAVVGAFLFFSCGMKTNQKLDVPLDQDYLERNVLKSNTVNSPKLVNSKEDGILLLTAENGKPIGLNIKYMPEWRAFGWFTSEDMVEWEVLIEKSGEYEVYLEWSVSNEEAGKEFLLKSKDQQLIGVVGQSGSWETFKNDNIGKMLLTQGRQKITFSSKTKFEKGALLDLRQIKLIVVK